MHILNIDQLTGYINDVLASDMVLSDVWVRGEVSNLARPASGHLFFTLKDAVSQVRAVLFRHHARYQSYAPADGALVVAHGRVALYEATGALQLYVDLVQPAGVGAAFLQMEQLRTRLAEEGLFDAGRKRPLPSYPRCIGVVTSASGAVWHDIVTVVRRRYAAVELVLSPAQVQGDGAAASVVAGLRRLWELDRCDLIIVARGGGSAEDLGAFNAESVARAIYASPVPVISAIGHETDVTIADDVADMRAPTPSAAAELAVPDGAALRLEVERRRGRLRAALAERLATARDELEHGARHLEGVSPRRRMRAERRRLDGLAATTARAMQHRLTLERQRTLALEGRLGALNPRAVLARGYAVVTRAATGAVVGSAAGIVPGERVRVRVRDGAFEARVEGQSEGGEA